MGQIDQMGMQGTAKVQIQLVLITDDHDFTGDLLEIFARSPYVYVPVSISRGRDVVEQLIAAVSVRSGRFPVVVVADYRFLGAACVDILEAVQLLRARIAIECIVVRPPQAHAARAALLDVGAVFFEPELSGQDPVALSH